MNKKTLRYLLPLTLIMSLLLSVTAFADTSSPTADQSICVVLQGRPGSGAVGEPITYTLQQGADPATNHTATTDADGCFEVATVGVGLYNLVIDGEDLLATPSASVQLDGTDDDFRSGGTILTLREGDIEPVGGGDNDVDLDDFASFGTAFNQAQPTSDLGDLDEDGDSDLDDFATFGINFGTTGSRAGTAEFINSDGVRGTATITMRELEPKAVTAGQNAQYAIDINANGEEITLVSVHFSTDGTKLVAPSVLVGNACTTSKLTRACDSNLSIANPSGKGTSVTPNPSPNNGMFTVAVLTAVAIQPCGGAAPACADGFLLHGGDAATEAGTFYKNTARATETFANCVTDEDTPCDTDATAVSMSNIDSTVGSSAPLALVTIVTLFATVAIVQRNRRLD